ncbi:sensor histidine kinase [Granulosicoccus sp. 3-233]|uniref:sensor histidine kinase n=1 Tax=Granulosicoccus sp. 3-233 TaxID=3417969 RepID=UPI003D324AA0
MLSSLFVRLCLVFTAILLCLGLLTLAIANRNQQRYFEEFTQELNRPVAMYIATQKRLFVDGEPDHQALRELAAHVMVINPSLQVYLLDRQGRVLDSLAGEPDAVQRHVDLEPIQRFVAGTAHLPLYGDNPAVPGQQRVFSAYPVSGGQAGNSGCESCGYVYAVLGGERHSSLWQSLAGSYALRDNVAMFAVVLALALVAGMALFFLMTRPLRAMTASLGQWRLAADRAADSSPVVGRSTVVKRGNELEDLESTCHAMLERLDQQYQFLDSADRRRREFLTSVSHDLRTPLTSLSGAVETLLLKHDSLSDEERQHYLLLAQRQGGRLWRLIAQVFELARLDSGDIDVHVERIPFSELVFDTAQDFETLARERSITLQVSVLCKDKSLWVMADMGLLQRVIENLLANAIRHTARGGQVAIRLDRSGDSMVQFEIEDSGCGFSRPLAGCSLAAIRDVSATADKSANHRAPNIERGGSDPGGKVILRGSGLGLGIVQRILTLHDSEALVWSRPGEGSRVCFELAAD